MNSEEQAGGRLRLPIRIDKEGIWYYQGAEMFRKDILAQFFEALGYDNEGGYYVEMEGRRHYIEVDDTPYVVRSVTVHQSESAPKGFEIFLNDDSWELLDADSLRISPEHILYCSVKNSTFEARFSRAAYYQIAPYFDHNEETGEFMLVTKTGTYRVHIGNDEPPNSAVTPLN